MEPISIALAILAVIAAFMTGWWSRPKALAEAGKLNAERNGLVTDRLYDEFDRLHLVILELRGQLTTSDTNVIRLCDLIEIAQKQLDEGEPDKAEATLKKADDGPKAGKS